MVILRTFGLYSCFILWTCLSHARVMEPKGQECSRFVYEYRLMERLLMLEMEMASLKERQTEAKKPVPGGPDAVAMTVGLTQDINVPAAGQIKYDRVILNTGGAYNETLNAFVAPVGGVYIFAVCVCVKDGHWMTFQMMKNTARVGYLFTGDSSWTSCSSQVVTLYVDVGDKVWLQRVGGSGDILHESYGFNTFTAVLINGERHTLGQENDNLSSSTTQKEKP